MFSFLGFGKGKIKEALKNGAAIIDVRTAHEYDEGRIRGSINIPLERLKANIERIKAMKKPVVLCCSNGGRSEEAKQILKNAGVKEVYNGGSFDGLLRMVNRL